MKRLIALCILAGPAMAAEPPDAYARFSPAQRAAMLESRNPPSGDGVYMDVVRCKARQGSNCYALLPEDQRELWQRIDAAPRGAHSAVNATAKGEPKLSPLPPYAFPYCWNSAGTLRL